MSNDTNKKPVYKRVWFWVAIVFVVLWTLGKIVGKQ